MRDPEEPDPPHVIIIDTLGLAMSGFVFERIFTNLELYEFTVAEMAELTTVSSLDQM